MNLLEERLKEQKRLRQEATKASGRPGQYTPVDLIPDPMSKEDSGSGSYDSEGSIKESPARVRKVKPLPAPPPKKRTSEKTFAASTEAEPVSEHRQSTKAKPPAPVNPKPIRRSNHPEPSTHGTSKQGGVAFLRELERKTKQSSSNPDQGSNPTPRTTKPKTTSKPSSHALKASEQSSSAITDSYEPPEYANTNFDNKHGKTESPVSSGRVASKGAPGSKNTTVSAEPENIYMNLHPAPVAPRRKVGGARAAPPQTEYQNIGSGQRRKH